VVAIPGPPVRSNQQKGESSICIEWNVRAHISQLLAGCQVKIVLCDCVIVHTNPGV
jgi:hypothetical protein